VARKDFARRVIGARCEKLETFGREFPWRHVSPPGTFTAGDFGVLHGYSAASIMMNIAASTKRALPACIPDAGRNWLVGYLW
jgi:hypothetical protein